MTVDPSLMGLMPSQKEMISFSLPYEETEDDNLQTRKLVLTKDQMDWNLDLRLPRLQNC